MNLAIFQIFKNDTVRQALSKIEENKSGFILVINSAKAVIGLVTDGDLRRHLLVNLTIEDKISKCANKEFIWFPTDTPRELLLKQLNSKIQFIPLLDSKMKLKEIITNQHFPLISEDSIYVRSRSPVRISFGGGGSDLNHFIKNDTGAVINATIALYSHATLRKRQDKKIIIKSSDLEYKVSAKDLETFLKKKSKLGLIQAILKAIQPEFGFELYLRSDFPLKSGLGGSAVVSAAVLGCFNEFREDKWNRYELVELAFQAERIFFGIEGGWQDQYATIFGGVNFIEFHIKENIIHPLRVDEKILLELEENLILCDTQISHESGDIHKTQRKEMSKPNVRENVKKNVNLTYKIRDQLLRGNLLEFGRSLNNTWKLKRTFSEQISTPKIDLIYQESLKRGAIGGKLLGAGGGGFLLFYCEPFRRSELVDYLKSINLFPQPVQFENKGLQTWVSRERSTQP